MMGVWNWTCSISEICLISLIFLSLPKSQPLHLWRRPSSSMGWLWGVHEIMHIFSPLPSRFRCFPLSHISLYSTVNHYNQLPCPFLNPPYSPRQTAMLVKSSPPPTSTSTCTAGHRWGKEICKTCWLVSFKINHQSSRGTLMLSCSTAPLIHSLSSMTFVFRTLRSPPPCSPSAVPFLPVSLKLLSS